MYPMAEFLREKSLRWFGHVQRRDKDEATRKILQMTVDGKQNQGTPKLRWRDLVKEVMARNQMTTEMAEDRTHWHVMIQAGILQKCRGGKVRNVRKTKKFDVTIPCCTVDMETVCPSGIHACVCVYCCSRWTSYDTLGIRRRHRLHGWQCAPNNNNQYFKMCFTPKFGPDTQIRQGKLGVKSGFFILRSVYLMTQMTASWSQFELLIGRWKSLRRLHVQPRGCRNVGSMSTTVA